VGYQAAGTLGRQIVDGEARVRIFGEVLPVKARVERISGFSAHADKAELLRWAGAQSAPPRRAFVVHGEADVAARFATHLREARGWETAVPGPGDRVALV
jgi:metallo-beta-lactamase family protein